MYWENKIFPSVKGGLKVVSLKAFQKGIMVMRLKQNSMVCWFLNQTSRNR